MYLHWLLLFGVLATAVASGSRERCDGQSNHVESEGDNEPTSADCGRENPSRALTVARGPVMECQGNRPGSTRYHIGDGFYYHLQRQCGARLYLRCTSYYSNPRCTARAYMNADRSDFIIGENPHNHGPDHSFEQVIRLRENLLEASRVRPNTRLELIYHEVCRSVRRDVSSRLTLASIRSAMVRAQSEHRPAIPNTFQELSDLLNNDEALGRTHDMDCEFFQGLVGEVGHQSLVFMSLRVAEGVSNLRNLFGDGTFYARPSVPASAQLYTLLTSRDNHVIPLCYALMESQTTEAYLALFRFVRRQAPNLQPDFIMTDFEAAQQNALVEVFPRSRLTGCLWHYTRALARSVRRLGLHPLVRDSANAFRIARLSLAIPLAPPGRLQEALNSIVEEARRLDLADSFEEFFQYIRQTWLEGVGQDVLSVFGVRHRTNNIAEAFNRNLNSRLVRRPNVWRFIEVLREMEDISWRDLGRVEVGQAPSRARRVSALLNDARIRSCSRQIMDREMDMAHFLSTVSHHLEGTLHDSLVLEDPDRPHSPNRTGRPARSSLPASTEQDNGSRGATTRQALESAALQAEELEPSQEPSLVDALDALEHYEDIMEVETCPEPRTRSSRRGRGGRRGTRSRQSRHLSGGRRQNAPTAVSAVVVSRECPLSPPARLPSPPARLPSPPARLPSPPARLPSPPARQPSPPARPASPPARPAVPRPSRRPPHPRGRQGHEDVYSSNRLTAAPASQPARRAVPMDDFSDPEDLPELLDDEERRWSQCIICYGRVGHYCLLGCGACPVCGTCLRSWFGGNRYRNCPVCGGPHRDWVRLQTL